MAEQQAPTAPVPVETHDGRAEQLPFSGASFDAAVVSMTLCSVADPHTALAELHRVLRRAAGCGSSNTSRPARPQCGASSAGSMPPSGPD
ncbi:class I SAM-dependent methyltransferase [Streptomyces sp. PSKA30]|uniref:class I SAM-dependent methyltransferase n=1 Tax=Streptomyces sp. PSKA30 TaxID=2874597 RepID=UPI0021E4A7B2|nr:class I SAM-dependent methyltransferase [Streptomyces sp. PSKA30]